MWQCPILHYWSFSSYLCVPKWSLVLDQMLLLLPVTKPKLHKKPTKASSASLLFGAPGVITASSVSSAREMQIPGSILETRHFRPPQQCNKAGWNNCASTRFSAGHFFKRTHIFQDAAHRNCPHSPQAVELLRSTTEHILLFCCRNKWCCGERRGANSRRESKPSTATNSTLYELILQHFHSCLHSSIG